jgi:hypothetical protein
MEDNKRKLDATEKVMEATEKLMQHMPIGRVVGTQEVKPRKRIKLAVPPKQSEPDYKTAFLELQQNLKKSRDVSVCSVCCDSHAGQWDRPDHWTWCANCDADICPDCLPPYDEQAGTNECIRLLYYCPQCKDHIGSANEEEIEPGYTIMSVQIPRY